MEKTVNLESQNPGVLRGMPDYLRSRFEKIIRASAAKTGYYYGQIELGTSFELF